MPAVTAQPSFSSIAQSFMETQEQLMPVEVRRNKLFIGIPKETTLQENRVRLSRRALRR
jgi:alanine dehydrogenase